MRFLKKLKIGKYDVGSVAVSDGMVTLRVQSRSRDCDFVARFPGRGEMTGVARLASVVEAVKAIGVEREFTGESYGGYAVSMMSEKDIPAPFEMADGKRVEVDTRAFRAAWDWAEVATSEKSRFGFHGVLVDGSTVVGTDGKRLHYADVPGLSAPRSILPLVVGVFLTEFADATFRVTFGADRVTIDTGRATMTVLHVLGQYPDYRAVIPAPSGVAVPMAPIAEHAKKGKPFTSRDSASMRIVSVDGRVHVKCQKPDVGTYDGDTGIEADVVSVAFNPDYVMDACPKKTTPVIRWSKPNQPATVEIGDGRHAVLMPITLRNA